MDPRTRRLVLTAVLCVARAVALVLQWYQLRLRLFHQLITLLIEHGGPEEFGDVARRTIPRTVFYHSHIAFGMIEVPPGGLTLEALATIPHVRFFSAFRMSAASFAMLYDRCHRHLPVAEEDRLLVLLVAIFRLASGCLYRVLSVSAGFPVTTVKEWCLMGENALARGLSTEIRLPEPGTAERQAINDDFYQAFLLNNGRQDGEGESWHNICGAIDGTHIYMKRSWDIDDASYRDRNGQLSLLVHAMASYDLTFTHTAVAFPGSTHDSGAFRHTALWDPVRPYRPPAIVGEDQLIIADSAYAVSEYVIPAFKRDAGAHDLIPNQRNFNKALSSLRNCVERAFRLLKARWLVLSLIHARSHDRAVLSINCSLYLHNFCLRQDLGEYVGEFQDPDPELGADDPDSDEEGPTPGEIAAPIGDRVPNLRVRESKRNRMVQELRNRVGGRQPQARQ